MPSAAVLRPARCSPVCCTSGFACASLPGSTQISLASSTALASRGHAHLRHPAHRQAAGRVRLSTPRPDAARASRARVLGARGRGACLLRERVNAAGGRHVAQDPGLDALQQALAGPPAHAAPVVRERIHKNDDRAPPHGPAARLGQPRGKLALQPAHGVLAREVVQLHHGPERAAERARVGLAQPGAELQHQALQQRERGRPRARLARALRAAARAAPSVRGRHMRRAGCLGAWRRGRRAGGATRRRPGQAAAPYCAGSGRCALSMAARSAAYIAQRVERRVRAALWAGSDGRLQRGQTAARLGRTATRAWSWRARCGCS